LVAAFTLLANFALADIKSNSGGPVKSYSNYTSPALDDFNVIWDQQPDIASTALINQAFPDFADFSTYMVNDFNVDQKILLGSLTTYFTDAGNLWPAAGQAWVSLYPKVGSLPGSGDLAGNLGLVNVTINDLGDVNAVTADLSGLGITVQPGTYWIGLTPDLAFGQFGQEFHFGALGGVVKNPSASRNPGGAFGVGTEWVPSGLTFLGVEFDSSFTLTGKKVIPEPTSVAVLALGLVGLISRRRR
jgi:hypothetical protein